MVMPLWDHNPFKQPIKPFVTWTLIALNVVAFVLELGTLPDNVSAHMEVMVLNYGTTPAALVHDIPGMGRVSPEVSLLTYQFIHSSTLHLLGNMVFLWVFGDDVEEALGHWRFLAFYLMCGVAAGIAYVAIAPHSGEPLVGASGSVAGVLAGYLMFRPCQKVWILLVRIPLRLDAFWVIGGWVALQFVEIMSQSDDNVAYSAHIGGFIAGAILFPLLRRPGVKLFECIRARKPPATPQGAG